MSILSDEEIHDMLAAMEVTPETPNQELESKKDTKEKHYPNIEKYFSIMRILQSDKQQVKAELRASFGVSSDEELNDKIPAILPKVEV